MNITNRDCPCYECICVPICRRKEFTPLLKECQPLSYFYYNEGAFFETIEEFSIRYHCLVQCLKNPKWSKLFDPKKD